MWGIGVNEYFCYTPLACVFDADMFPLILELLPRRIETDYKQWAKTNSIKTSA